MVELEKSETLRKQAERTLKGRTSDLEKLSTRDIQSLVHELQVHQIELEMQNEELRRAQSEFEDSRNRYSNLYDFATIGYFTFDRNGLIIEVNLTGANLLGVERSFLIKKPFSLYIAFGSRDVFYLHLRKVFRIDTRQTCEVKLMGKDGIQFDARLESLAVQDSKGNFSQCRTAISDITERKRAQEALHRAHDELEIRVEERTAELAKANEELKTEITERKRAEEELRKSEVRFRSVLDNSQDVIYRLNVQTGRYEYISPSAETVVGFSPDELMALDLETSLAMIHPADLPAMRTVLARLEDTGKGEMEYRQRTKNGEYRWISNHISLVKDSAGRPLYRNGNIRDITERKWAEEALRESAAKYKLLTESILDTFTAIDRNLKFTYWNRAAEELVGISANEALGKTVIEVFGDNEITRRAFGYYRECVKTRQPIRYETGNVIRGRKYDLEVRLYPTNDGVSIIGRDITERKMAEKALLKSHDELELRVQERTAELQETNEALLEREASYRELTESIDDLFYAMDRDLRYTYWNKASESLSGILAKDAIGKSIYELFPDVKGTKVDQIYIEVLKTQQPERFESEYKLGDKKIVFEINAYPTKTGLSVIAKDITEKKKLEAQLLRAQRMESIGTLAGGIAHDLNNVLTPMMLSLQILKEKFTDEQSQKLLNILEKNSQRGADLIKQVLSFARGVEGERNPLHVKHIITEIEKIAKETFPRNIEIRTDRPKDLFAVSGDATQLHQVIMNLCVNARDAMPDGGKLIISAENFFIDENYARMHTEAKVGPYVVIAVSDTGIGIPHHILDRIFEPFFTTKKFGKGTGLGLSTTLAIVKSHGGFINVYSEIGNGTTFRVYLPAIKTKMQNVDEQQLELPGGQGEFVLVAEDEDSVRGVTVLTLEKYGYNVLAANDGAEAIALYAQNEDKIKVILMDMMMPVMDGEASIRAIRKINPEVKVIVVSGLMEKGKLKDIADTRVQAFLPKPYTAEKLLKTISEVIGKEYEETGLNNR